jgi:hypothetical protein
MIQGIMAPARNGSCQQTSTARALSPSQRMLLRLLDNKSQATVRRPRRQEIGGRGFLSPSLEQRLKNLQMVRTLAL